MYETVSVDAAIAKGDSMVKYPVITILSAPTLISVLLALGDFIPPWVIPVTLVISVVIGWFIYSLMVTRWRIWAFENVRNVHELRAIARQEQYWPGTSVFGKLEIHTKGYRAKWQQLQNKFDQADVFQDDPTIPAETIIYYSKGMSYLQCIILLIPLAMGIYLLVNDKLIIGSIIVLGVIYYVFSAYKQATNKEPQIIISNKGIQTVSTPFYTWTAVRNEKIVLRRIGRNVYTHLQYDYPGGMASLKIDEYATDRRKLNRLLVVYRGRSGNVMNGC